MSFVQVEPVESLVLSPIPESSSATVYTDKQYDNSPGALVIFMNEWEDYGTFGYGDQNGQPLRAGEYFSWDEEGDYPMNKSLNDHLAGTIPDEKLRKKVTQQVLEWMWKKSDEVFYIEQ